MADIERAAPDVDPVRLFARGGIWQQCGYGSTARVLIR